MKIRYYIISGIPLGLIVNHLLVGFYKFTAEVALKLRPELINLTWWEAFWSMHFHDWLWLTMPETAYIIYAFLSVLTGVSFTLYVGAYIES